MIRRKRIANHFEDVAVEARAGRLTESRARKTIADIFALANDADLPRSTIREYLSSWLKRKSLEAGERTHARYTTVVEQIEDYLGARANQAPRPEDTGRQ